MEFNEEDDEILDLGEPHEMSNEEFEDFKREVTDGNEPLDLGESHKMTDEEFEDFKKEIGDEPENSLDIGKEGKDILEEDDELLDLGKPHEMTEEEFKDFKDDLERDKLLDLDKTNEITDEKSKDVVEDGNEKTSNTDTNSDEKYIPYDQTDDYKGKATDSNSTGDDLHKGFTDHLKKWNK